MPDPASHPWLTEQEWPRYARQVILPEVGRAGQERLKRASVLLVGLGGLGAPAALYLAAAGVGRLGLLDDDAVDRTNLQRQVLYGEQDVGRSKVDAARDRLRDLNPHVALDLYPERLTAERARRLILPYDVVVDCTDNFTARYLINDACVMLGKPDVYGAIFRFEGQVSVVGVPSGPCYRCLYPQPPPPGAVPDCAEGGVLGVLPGLIGLMQTTEVFKLILGAGTSLAGRLLLVDALSLRFREMRLAKDPSCPLCGPHPTITRLREEHAACPRDAGDPDHEISAPALKRELEEKRDLILLDVREPHEQAMATLPGALLMPMGEVPGRLAGLPRDRDIVCYCRSGGRSARVVGLLLQSGFSRVRNLVGGALAWAKDIDPNLPV